MSVYSIEKYKGKRLKIKSVIETEKKYPNFARLVKEIKGVPKLTQDLN